MGTSMAILVEGTEENSAVYKIMERKRLRPWDYRSGCLAEGNVSPKKQHYLSVLPAKCSLLFAPAVVEGG